MSRVTIAGGVLLAVLLLLTAVAAFRSLDRTAAPPVTARPAAVAADPAGFLHGRITTVDGATFEGRLRFGGGQEAFWSDTFNGSKRENVWLSRVPPEARPKERRRIEILGIRFSDREHPLEVRRLLRVRFGDLARIEVRGREVRATLRSGTTYELDRFEAGDLDDGVRVWDGRHGVVDLDGVRIGTIEFLPTPALDGLPSRLHGTVHTPRGEFTGFIEWTREERVGTDELDGRSADGDVRLPFDTIRSIERRPSDGASARLLDGREIVLSEMRGVGPGKPGIYVDDPRFGRVGIPWETLERVAFTPAGSGPGYAEFEPGRPLEGSVTTRDGRHLAGRLVFDLDECETIETLEAPADGVGYALPFGLVASIVLPVSGDEPARVTLRGGEVLRLEREGDLGPGNAGVLVFGDGGEGPDYLPWNQVERVDFERPPTSSR